MILKTIGDTADKIFLHPFTLRIGWGLLHLFGYWPVIFRATMYFLIGALPTVIKSARDAHKDPASVDKWMLVSVGAEVLYQGVVALRAYFDGSATRLMPKNNGDTGFFHKPTA